MRLYPFQFVPNQPDELHCFQAAYSMVLEGLTGEAVTLEDAENATGFRHGMQSWPFAGMLSLAKWGLHVRNVEDFAPTAFVDDPVSEIHRQAEDSEVADFIVAESDLAFEVDLVRQCLACSHIDFDQRRPRIDEVLAAARSAGTMAICNVNYRQLVGEDGYYGHFVVVDGMEDGAIAIHNPGPPPMPDARIQVTDFLRAWHSPTESAANVIVISRRA